METPHLCKVLKGFKYFLSFIQKFVLGSLFFTSFEPKITKNSLVPLSALYFTNLWKTLLYFFHDRWVIMKNEVT